LPRSRAVTIATSLEEPMEMAGKQERSGRDALRFSAADGHRVVAVLAPSRNASK